MTNQSELELFFATEFPQADFVIEEIGKRSARIKKPITEAHLRPGGTVSGPVLMELADAALYVAILGELGMVTMAVTTSLNVNFLSKASADGDIIADCRLIKVGKSLVVGEVSLYSGVSDAPVAHAVGTYALPS